MVSIFAESEESDQHYADEELRANQDNRGQTVYLECGKLRCSKIASSSKI